MVQAYILVQTEVGMAGRVAEAVSKFEDVLRADIVTGPYDVVVLTEAATVDRPVVETASRVQRVEGVTRTLTCSILNR